MATSNRVILCLKQRVVITKRARVKLNWGEVLHHLTEHVHNNVDLEALAQTKPAKGAESLGPRLRSKFVARNGTEFLISTDLDHSLTIIDSVE